MPFNRRDFIHKLGRAAGSLAFASLLNPALAKSLEKEHNRIARLTPEASAKDEAFWRFIQQSYTVSPTILNLNNGGVSPQPKVVQEAFERYTRYCNEGPSLYMWRFLDLGRQALREKLADLAGCSPETIAINRNASESLETIIFGMRLEKGDEVILSKQDYPSMINAWKQRAKRDGIVLKWLNFDMPMEDDDFVVKQYVDAFTAKTKVAHITHMISWTGQILPAKKIIDAARKRGIKSIVDAAHSFAQIDFKISDLDPDYLGTSLHKWLCAPFGTGMLYVKKENIAELWPMMASSNPEEEDIRKFESLGTRSIAAEQAIAQAINFHHYIGIERKQARLFYLKNYWVEKAKKEIPGIRFYTSMKPEYSCAICTFYVEGFTNLEINNSLFRDPHRIHVGLVNEENLKGVRVSPNVYTLTEDLDRFVRVLKSCLKDKEDRG